MHRVIASTALAALTLLAGVSSAQAAELVVNGSFEAETLAAGSFGVYSNLTGWTGAPDIELRNDAVGQAFAGVNFVELDTFGNSAMSQAVATDAGALYTLSFAYSARPNTASTNDIAVYWNGSLVDTLTGSNSTASHAWSVYRYDVFGAGSQTTLSFAAGGPADTFGGSLDAVSVTAAVPEPGTWALMAAGLAAVGALARRRRS